ncbi:MAG: aminoacyl-tRNA hydrolase [Deltaproteobacteria bacterium]|nr:aminoacyl-tRNA hydrolase [Deltaproteobacteria bacterium]
MGLGNPGRAYENTRHNAGFMLIDRIASRYKIRFSRRAGSLMGRGVIAGAEAVLLKPQTFMNLSGQAVKEAADAFSAEPSSIIAAYDDCDLPLGKIRLRRGGGSGGHKGAAAIIERIGTGEFKRVRLGIGRPPDGDTVEYVLTPFSPEEKEALEAMLDKGVEAIEAVIAEGIDMAMNRFNPSD